MGFQLTIAEGKEAGKEFVFDQASVVIGRTSDCDIILYDPGVSRKHARIFNEGELFFVEDMGSSNGTKVNGSVIKKKQLADGDSIALGPVVLSFTSQLAPEVPAAPPASEVASQSTRIVPAGQIKRTRGKGVALLPPGASEAEVKELVQTKTATMQAVKPTSGTNIPAAAPPSKEGKEGKGEAGLARSADVSLARPPDGADLPRPRPAPQGAKLSAAEKARIRRESKGVLASIRIFWIEAGALTRAVLTLMVMGAGLGGAGALYYMATEGGPTAPDRPEPTKLTRVPLEDSFGLGLGVTWHRPDMKVFTFDFTAPLRAVVLLHFQAKDISQGEVVVTVNGVDVGAVPPDTLNSAEKSHELVVPPSVLKKGESNQVIFDSTKNPPGQETWRIWNAWVEVAMLPEIPPDLLLIEANKAFQSAQLFFDRRDVGAENRYQAWKEYRNAWLMLEAHPEPKPELYLLARDKVKEAQQELDRTCAKLMLEEETYYNHKDWRGARSTLDHVKKYFPGNDQPCAFRAEQKRGEHGL